MKAAVIGVGAMGRNHARVYNEIDGIELVGVADADARRAEDVARRFKVKSYTDYRALLQEAQPQVVSVAVPTSQHLSVAREVIAAGVHVLVEKPIASTLAEAEEMIRLARDKGVKLAVGYIERFNPAVIELKKRLDQGELGRILLVHARRLGPFPERIQDMGVVIDLATHDLDVMAYLLNSRVERIYAETMRKIHTQYEDLLSGLLRFENGAIGVLDINRLTPTKVRELTVTGEKGMFVVNYITQDLYFYENNYARGDWDNLGFLKGVGEGNMIRPTIARKEPLRAELESFLKAVQSDTEPLVGGQDGLRALNLALHLVDSGAEHGVLAE